jgi:phosphoribosyl-AMP cyclohydrolase / phosphoribosyl-ATP pyrophosphohydrolase
MERALDLGSLRFDERGLLPVVVQDVASGAVLMLAWADREAVEKTLETGFAHFWSRSRRALWKKGETSGNVLSVVEALADCDGDSLLLRAVPAGPTCHRGTRSCFEPNPARLELGWLARALAARRGADPAGSYTARLLGAGVERIAQKVGEEGVETALAAVAAAHAGAGEGAETRREALAGEAADLVYHLLVLLLASGLGPEDVAEVLLGRHGLASSRHSSGEASNSGREEGGPE